MTPYVRVQVDRKRIENQFARALRHIEDAMRTALYQEAEAAAAEAKKTTLFRDRTGKLRRSIGVHYRGLHHVSVEARRPYASFVHDGTAPHEIRAKKARALAFVVNGKMLFRRRVRHPGSRARPYLMLPVSAAAERLQARIEALIERVLG